MLQLFKKELIVWLCRKFDYLNRVTMNLEDYLEKN